MAKVIGIKSKKEINELPFNFDNSMAMMEAILALGSLDHKLVSGVIDFISNNSGVTQEMLIRNRIAGLKKAGK